MQNLIGWIGLIYVQFKVLDGTVWEEKNDLNYINTEPLLTYGGDIWERSS